MTAELVRPEACLRKVVVGPCQCWSHPVWQLPSAPHTTGQGRVQLLRWHRDKMAGHFGVLARGVHTCTCYMLQGTCLEECASVQDGQGATRFERG